MNDLKIFENAEFGQIRTVVIDGEPWFVGKDVAGALGYSEPRSVVSKKVDEEDKGVAKMDTPSGLQEMTIINESGLYALIFGSKLDSAKKFKHWVTAEILPSIRKTGKYEMEDGKLPCPLHPSIASSLADLGRVTERIMKNQGSEPHQIAEVFKLECEQFGVRLPDYFVKVPEYKQMKLWDIMGKEDCDAET